MVFVAIMIIIFAKGKFKINNEIILTCSVFFWGGAMDKIKPL